MVGLHDTRMKSEERRMKKENRFFIATDLKKSQKRIFVNFAKKKDNASFFILHSSFFIFSFPFDGSRRF